VLGTAVLLIWGLLSLISWIGHGVVHLAGAGGHHLSAWPLTHVITDPIQHTLAGANLPANTATLTAGLATAVIGCWVGSLFGWRGARIGWAVIGAATTALVYAGTDEPGRLVAAAVTLAAWSLLSIPAYWRTRPRAPREQGVGDDSKPREPRPADDDLLV
jgi:hypothetical protein